MTPHRHQSATPGPFDGCVHQVGAELVRHLPVIRDVEHQHVRLFVAFQRTDLVGQPDGVRRVDGRRGYTLGRVHEHLLASERDGALHIQRGRLEGIEVAA